MTTKRELEDRAHYMRALESLGFTSSECETLRRASMTLRRWHELECGTGTGQTSYSVERDETTGKTYMRVQYPTQSGYFDRAYPTPDRETGARARIDKIVAKYPGLSAYIQTDPRGAALYILRPGDVPQGKDPDSYYTRGICVY